MNKLSIKNLVLFSAFAVGSHLSFMPAQAQVPGAIVVDNQAAPLVVQDGVTAGSAEAEILPFEANASSLLSQGGSQMDPCPEPKTALENTPSDLKKIQEDITRFNLCLQRAQLLARLNDLALENIETINTSIDKRIEEKAMAFAPTVAMPDVAAPAFPDVAAGEVTPEAIVEEEPTQEWSINEIRSKDNRLLAVLTDADGNRVNVFQGDLIPETEIRVSNISQTSVTILDGENTTKLKWKN